MGKIQFWKSVTPGIFLELVLHIEILHSQTCVHEYIYVYLETYTLKLLLFPFSTIPQYP